MEPRSLCTFIAVLTTTAFILTATDGAIIDSRRQVLPPMPGYIPVYIQHGDVPPEDLHEYAGLFQVGDQNVPPRVSVTMPIITTEAVQADDARTTSHDAIDTTTQRDTEQTKDGVTDSTE